MKNNKLFNILAGIIFAFCLVALPASVWAGDWETYQGGVYNPPSYDPGIYAHEDRVLPVVGGSGSGPSWFTAVDYFPDVADREADDVQIDGHLNNKFEAEGRLIVATGSQIFLQRTYGSDQWDVVANIVDDNDDPVLLDPSFIKVSPNGKRIALGIGYEKPLVIINTQKLSINSPVEIDIDNEDDTSKYFLFPLVGYYDAEWYDDQYLFIDSGSDWPGEVGPPPYDPNLYNSGIGIVDVDTNYDRALYEGHSFIVKPGNSAGLTFDSNGNFYCGVGFGSATGEIRIFRRPAGFDPGAPGTIPYPSLLLLKNGDGILSSAWLGVDAEDNVTVGGGNVYGAVPDYGYAALIHHSVANRVLAQPPTGGVVTYIPSEWQEFAPDSCENDSATGIFFGSWGRGLAVMYNRVTEEPSCATTDNWNPGVVPYLKVYYPDSAPDGDTGGGDGIPNSADNAYLTRNSGQQDTDGDGYGNACDADIASDDDVVNGADFTAFRTAWITYNADADFDSDNDIDGADYNNLRVRFNDTTPFY